MVGYAQAHGYMTPTTPSLTDRVAPIIKADPRPDPNAEPVISMLPWADSLFEFALSYIRDRAFGRAMAFMRKSEWPPKPEFDTVDSNDVTFTTEHAHEFWGEDNATD